MDNHYSNYFVKAEIYKDSVSLMLHDHQAGIKKLCLTDIPSENIKALISKLSTLKLNEITTRYDPTEITDALTSACILPANEDVDFF